MARSLRNTTRIHDRPLLFAGSKAAWMERELARLIEENERLQKRCSDLEESAEIWIHLYEAALDREKKAQP